MLSLLFLFLGVLFLLLAAGRIWIDRTPVDSPTIDSAAATHHSEPVRRNNMSQGKDSTV